MFTPSLSGVGERSHLLSRDVNLNTHIDDVVNLIRWEELSDVVLCGHSYGGAVISGVADRVPERLRALVYLDAFVLENGQSLHDTLPAAQRDMQLDLTKKYGEGWKVPPIPGAVFNVNAADLAWVDSQCTMQPLATFQQPLMLTEQPAPRCRRRSSWPVVGAIPLFPSSTSGRRRRAGRRSRYRAVTT